MTLGWVALVLSLLAAPLPSDAQQARKIPVVGYLWNSSEALAAPNLAAFVKELIEASRDVLVAAGPQAGRSDHRMTPSRAARWWAPERLP